MAERCCHHRYRWHHGPHKARNLGWLRYWKYRTRRHMAALYRDAHATGEGGWQKDGRGWRYQILAGAYTGHMCVTKLHVQGNKGSGGTPRERVRAVAEAAAANGGRHSFYSQSGTWTVHYAVTGEPWGYRSDCSQWVTSAYWSAGLPDPNGTGYTGGYTGTLGARGREISRSEIRPGDLVLFGPFPHHHVELIVDSNGRTVGHGSPPVDHGTIDLLAGEKHFRSYLP
jgi:hypothetical protein